MGRHILPYYCHFQLLEPCGMGIANTIGRAEMAAIAAVLHSHSQIAIDSLSSPQQIRKNFLYPKPRLPIGPEGGKFAGPCAGICAGIRAGTRRGCLSIAELWPCGYPRGGRKVRGIPRRYLRRYLRGYPRGMSLRMPLGGSADTCAGGPSLLGPYRHHIQGEAL